MSKLDWNYDEGLGCEVAWHNGYRIRAERDDCASNPLEEWDGNWPTLIYYDSRLTLYDKSKGCTIDKPLSFFSAQDFVVHQIAIAKLLGTTIRQISIDYDDINDDSEPPNFIWDGELLCDAFERELDAEYDSKKIDIFAELFKLLGYPVLNTVSRGYCQGGYAEVLVVATPEACEEFGTASTRAGGPGHHAHIDAYWERNLQGTVDLYGAWAWGDVYGYVIEQDINAGKPAACDQCGNTLNDGSDVCDQCGGDFEDPEPEWEEIDDGSCWGFYGSEHDESGLEDAALEALPDEPAPQSVRQPDAILEDA